MVVPNGSTSRPSMPKSKREYVPPLMLSKGRGKGLAGLYPFKSNARANVDGIGANTNSLQGSKHPLNHSNPGSDSFKRPFNLSNPTSDSLCVNKGPVLSNKRPFGHVTRYPTTYENVDRDVRASFNPLTTPHTPFDGNSYVNDHESSSESCNENINGDDEPHYSSHEDEDMHYQEGYANSNGNNHELNFQDCENDNEMEVPTTVQGGASGDQSIARKKAGNEKKRGRNKCKQIARLKPNEKLSIEFFNNRAVGENHKVFSRHLGIIVRDTNICPLRVRKWDDIGEREKDHMWTAVTDVFTSENMETYKEHVLGHMKELWTNWRGDLLRYNVTKKKISLEAATKGDPPKGLDKQEWRWLLKEVFSSDDFKKKSERNSANRSKYNKALMPRTGSKPIRQIIWDDLGGSKGNKPTLVDVFYTTRKKGDSLPNAETIQKHAEIQETMEKEPSLSYVQVAQKVFKSKSRDRVVGLGGGITLKDMTGPQPTREELETELIAAKKRNEDLTNHVDTIQEENTELKNRMSSVEAEMKMLKDAMLQQFNAFSNNGSNTQTRGT